jgi:hypothetical protein
MNKTRVFRLAIAVVVALLGVVLLGAFMSNTAALLPGPGVAQASLSHTDDVRVIRAARAISVPFGITDTLSLSEDGRQIVVAGHGAGAWPGVFKVEATVVQSSTEAVAYGEARGHLSGEGVAIKWQTTADALGEETFTAQSAHVYAKATVVDPPGRTTIYEWDKEVTLQTDGSYFR